MLWATAPLAPVPGNTNTRIAARTGLWGAIAPEDARRCTNRLTQGPLAFQGAQVAVMPGKRAEALELRKTHRVGWPRRIAWGILNSQERDREWNAIAHSERIEPASAKAWLVSSCSRAVCRCSARGF
jgi:hypothetical protein